MRQRSRSTSSAAGLPARKRLGRSPCAALPVVLHEMRPVRATAAHKTAALAELVCSNSFRSDDSEHNAVGLLHQELRRLGSLDHAGSGRQSGPRPEEHWRSTAKPLQKLLPRQLPASDLIDVRREEILGIAGARLGQRHHRDRAAHIVSRLPTSSPHLQGAICSRSTMLLRRSSTAIPSICRSPGCNRATTRPAPPEAARTTSTARSRAAVFRLRGRPLGRGQGRFLRLGVRRPILRRLLADRGHGAARTRNAASRPDEAVRAHQPARPQSPSRMQSCSCGRTTVSGRCSTWWGARPS